jgi:membrane-associated phospholipid phosphatase
MSSSSRRSRRTLFPKIVRQVDQQVGRRIYHAPTPAVVNKTLFTLSSLAENGLFWTGVVAAVALTGTRGRHAAARGALTLGASSLLTNLGAKKVIRAPRPRLRGLTHRHLNHTPTSPSFPSGHTATAAALATGIWAVSPRRGIPAAALAAAVSYSRLHIGAHWLSDVLTGTLVGITVGLLGRLIFPPAKEQPTTLNDESQTHDREPGASIPPDSGR